MVGWGSMSLPHPTTPKYDEISRIKTAIEHTVLSFSLARFFCALHPVSYFIFFLLKLY